MQSFRPALIVLFAAQYRQCILDIRTHFELQRIPQDASGSRFELVSYSRYYVFVVCAFVLLVWQSFMYLVLLRGRLRGCVSVKVVVLSGGEI